MSARPSPEDDARFMVRALELARARLGHTAPNPSVGCVLVAENVIVGEGATGNGGRPHAEEIALQAAGSLAHGATAYVTLEPCNQRSGGTASCSQLLLTAGISRVVIAVDDPHPLGAHGANRLGDAGVSIEHGLMGSEAESLNAGFFKRIATGRPWLAIDHDASSYDGAFDPAGDETPEAALDRLGAAGFTRVCVLPGTAIAEQLRALGLVDEDRC